eukprot:9498044-Pyramimonas_sp.AAC.1
MIRASSAFALEGALEPSLGRPGGFSDRPEAILRRLGPSCGLGGFLGPSWKPIGRHGRLRGARGRRRIRGSPCARAPSRVRSYSCFAAWATSERSANLFALRGLSLRRFPERRRASHPWGWASEGLHRGLRGLGDASARREVARASRGARRVWMSFSQGASEFG